MKTNVDPSVVRCINFFMNLVDTKEFIKYHERYLDEGDGDALRKYLTNQLVKTVNSHEH